MFYISARRVYLRFALALAIIMLVLPASVLLPGREPAGRLDSPTGFDKTKCFRLLMTDTQKVEKIPCGDYVIGAVAAEMGPDAPKEALKAQAVACYTFALYRKGENAGADYDLTDSPLTDQKYIGVDRMKQLWKDDFDSNYIKIKDAVSQAAGYALTDGDGRPVLAAYHAVSGGRTESAEVAWGKDYSYLQPVESIGDLLSPDYLSVRRFTPEEIKEKLTEVTFEGDPSVWIGGVDCSNSGTVLSVEICSVKVTGERLRELLSLRSACFDLSYSDSSFVFNVKGWGHMVGMSQYGARYLADTGCTFIEILSHYYTGCKMQII